MDARSIIAFLRKGEQPPKGAMAWMARSLADGTVSDAQAGAFAMAVCLQHLDAALRLSSGGLIDRAWGIACPSCWPRRLPPAVPTRP